MAKFVNLTPHDITLVMESGNLVIPATGKVARVKVQSKEIGSIAGIPVMKNFYSDVEGLPDPEDGTIYLVSSLVASRVEGRNDVMIPNDSVRDESGRIIGCKSFAIM